MNLNIDLISNLNEDIYELSPKAQEWLDDGIFQLFELHSNGYVSCIEFLGIQIWNDDDDDRDYDEETDTYEDLSDYLLRTARDLVIKISKLNIESGLSTAQYRKRSRNKMNLNIDLISNLNEDIQGFLYSYIYELSPKAQEWLDDGIFQLFELHSNGYVSCIEFLGIQIWNDDDDDRDYDEETDTYEDLSDYLLRTARDLVIKISKLNIDKVNTL